MSESNNPAENAEDKIENLASGEAEVRDMEKRLALLEKGAALSVAKSCFGKR